MSAKKLLLSAVTLASVLFVFESQSAFAADLPVYTKAPPVVAPAYNWNGFYVGGNLGWGFANADGTSSPLDPNSFGTYGTQTGSRSWNGVVGGGQIGFNWVALPNIVLGIEADLSGANLKDAYSTTSSDGTSFKTTDVDSFGTVRGRIGYAFNNWLIYGTGGAAWAHAKVTNTQGPCNPDPTCKSGPVPLGIVNANTATLTGWTAGGGVEVGITSSWTTRLEYIHMDFGSYSYANPSFNRALTISLKTDVVRLGLNYKFN